MSSHPPSDTSTGPIRMGLLGGSFNPVHLGHLVVARTARLAADLSEVLFVPAAESPYKRGRPLAPAEDRVAMLELALACEAKMRVATLELERGGVSWTVDTLRELSRPGVDMHLILGSDNLPGLPGWKDIDQIFELAKPLVVLRSQEAPAQLAAAAEALGSEMGALLHAGFCPVEPHPGESSLIRAGLAGGELDEGLLHEGVKVYIARRGLYGEGTL
ncbi:MAG: nicotinate (nicotinamide) nucleotide adenylyltransferase [Planctomycetota bacterium]|nr:nicotinate (nicotinamide) nucleotide adenylyltransferase [Planctomycetota bacterium]